MYKFPLTECLQKICYFFGKTCAIRFLMLKAFQKAKFYQNQTSGSGSKQRFGLLQEKQSFRQCAWGLRQLVLKPGFRYFLGYVRKTTGGGSNWPLPSSRNRVNLLCLLGHPVDNSNSKPCLKHFSKLFFL